MKTSGVIREWVKTDGVVLHYSNFPAAVSATGTLFADIRGIGSGIIQWTGASGTLTLPTAAAMSAFFAAPVQGAFDWSVINTGTGTCTIAVGSGHSTIGLLTIATNTAGRFRSMYHGSSSWVTYRIAS